MEKSDHYYQRRQRMKNLSVPTISEVRSELGDGLADALFKSCPDPLKPYMGLTPLLKGAGDDLWTSPSDILIGKVCLKPPLTSKHIKALTHQGILMIGRDIEVKNWNEAELIKKKALEESEEMLLYIAEMDKREAIAETRKEEQRKCDWDKEVMQIEFQKKLEAELEHLEKLLKQQYDELMNTQKLNLEKEWKDKLEEAVDKSVERLTKQCATSITKQEEELMKKFSIEMKKEEIRRKLEVKEAKGRCKESFKNLKHQLQCKNIANIMYVLCTERKKCRAEFEKVSKDYEDEVQSLHDRVIEKDVEISRLTKERDEKIQKCNLREECIQELLKQFQKFINFTLRASPTQAEFMLSVEKMMLFELVQAVAEVDKKHDKHLAETLRPWKTESETKSTTKSVKALIADDHHECYNEVELPETDGIAKSSEYLPAFHYDKHMYVREEFRNMMSQGVELSPSNLIWNRDVEHLMNELKPSQSSLERQRQEEEERKERLLEERGEKDIFRKERKEQKSKRTKETELDMTEEDEYCQPPYKDAGRKSIVCFKPSDDGSDLLFPVFEASSTNVSPSPSETYNELQAEITCGDREPGNITKICEPCQVPPDQWDGPSPSKGRALPLIGTRNSLELARWSNTPYVPAEPSTEDLQENVGILSVRDSLHKHRMSLKVSALKMRESLPKTIELRRRSDGPNKEASISSKESKRLRPLEGQGATSKATTQQSQHKSENSNISRLSLTRDSLLMHKQSLILKTKSRSSDIIKTVHAESRETIQLKRPPRMSEVMPQRTSLKKTPKRKTSSTSDIQSASVSATQSLDSMPQGRLRVSKLTMSRDSLELIRSHSKVSAHSKRKPDSKDSIEIKDGIISTHLQGKRLSPPKIKLDDDGSKTVKMSHIEVLPLEDRPIIPSDIYYVASLKENLNEEETEGEKEGSAQITAMYEEETTVKPDSPWLIYQEKTISGKEKEVPSVVHENFLKKPNVAHIAGKQKATEHLQKDKEFTIHRAASFISIFKKHPSLMKMFTACTK